MKLTGKQRRHLRALGHHLAAVAQVGKEGVSDAFLTGLERALLDHELIKIRVGQNAVADPDEVAAEIAGRTGATIAQVLGNTMLLYRPHPEEPTISLP